MDKVCGEQFALYLYENNHLQNLKVTKNRAKEIYTIFQNERQLGKIKFGTLCHRMYNYFGLLKYIRNGTLCFDKTEIKNLIKIKNGTAAKSEHSIPQNSSQDKSDLIFTIEGKTDFTNLILRKGIARNITLTVRNNSCQPIVISSFVSAKEVNGITFTAPNCPLTLPASACHDCILVAHFVNEGVIKYQLVLISEENGTSRKYTLDLIFHIHDELFDDLHPAVPYKSKPKAKPREYISQVDRGEQPKKFIQRRHVLFLEPYYMPPDLPIVLNAHLRPFEGMTSNQKNQLKSIKNLLNPENKKNCLKPDNYARLLNLLLFIEEHQLNQNIREYDQHDQILRKGMGNLLELQVPGLAEHRPSIIYSDSIFIRESPTSPVKYEGFAYEIRESSVLLKFSKNFMQNIFRKDKKFHVSFSFNRYSLKVAHQAINLADADRIVNFFFPDKIASRSLNQNSISWYHKPIEKNLEQQQAVRAILQKTAMPAPYIIFGPPGTGKTTTVVEAVMQIYKLTNENVLICTPSNSASNEIVERLMQFLPDGIIFRLMASSFPYNQIPKNILKYTNYKNGNYYQPEMSVLVKYRILIVTLVSAAKLVNFGCPKKHFGYVFIDESGQATECETLIPIVRVVSEFKKLSGQIVLAGDPHQLGPVVFSSLANDYGLNISMLERLMETCAIYKKDSSKNYNPNAITKLLKNYRSHPAILKVPNDLFYNGELEPAGDEQQINWATSWKGLPQPSFPIIFHNVIGIDQREKNSPSFFNIQEIQVIMDYLGQLINLQLQGKVVREEDIAIISPYKKQVEKIRNICTKKRYSKNLTIGSVEQIQGQEKMIIIISTVRSKLELVEFDVKFHLGFVKNSKRFNVALTRAKALLILVGNANLLQHDPNWKELIIYCKNNNAIIGDQFNEENASLNT